MYCVPFDDEQDYGLANIERNNYRLFNTMIDLLNKVKKDPRECIKIYIKKKLHFFII